MQWFVAGTAEYHFSGAGADTAPQTRGDGNHAEGE